MSEEIPNENTETPPPPEVKRGRGRPTKGPSAIIIDANYFKRYYLEKIKPTTSTVICAYCNKPLQSTSINKHNRNSYCSKYIQKKPDPDHTTL